MTRCWPVSFLAATTLAAQSPTSLEGLWQAKLRFGPEVRGTLVIDRPGGGWRASIAGRTAAVRINGDSLAFQLPDGGQFVGRFTARRNSVVGQWIQPRTMNAGWRFATPLALTSCGPACYKGDAVPFDDEFTYYLKVTRGADGSFGAFLRNPERNLGGQFIPVRRIERAGSKVALLDRRDSVIVEGEIRNGVMSIPLRGGTYDFSRVPDTAFSHFYPRGRPTARYEYVPPRQENDGWPVGTLTEVGIAEDSISGFLQRLINEPIDSVATPATHALLIARHGKLVLEEYFFGEYGDKPHETRSASKSVVSALIGAAMRAGVAINPETRVYATLRPGASDLPAHKQAMTLEHLLTMASGLDCDDNGETRPGNEDQITDQDSIPDWTGIGLGLNSVRPPGTSGVYCSIQSHLAGGVLAGISHRWLADMTWELLGEPLGMRRYHLPLTPVGEVYWGGGHRYRARDFMKFAQLYLNGGTWRGRRILSQEWINRSIVPRYSIGRPMYGYQWWIREYPYRGRTIKAYYAAGNGSQYSMWIPELDLVIAAFGGNYNSAAGFVLLQQLIPRYILAAVEPGR